MLDIGMNRSKKSPRSHSAMPLGICEASRDQPFDTLLPCEVSSVSIPAVYKHLTLEKGMAQKGKHCGLTWQTSDAPLDHPSWQGTFRHVLSSPRFRWWRRVKWCWSEEQCSSYLFWPHPVPHPFPHQWDATVCPCCRTLPPWCFTAAQGVTARVWFEFLLPTFSPQSLTCAM